MAMPIIDRRRFLQLTGTAAAGAMLAGSGSAAGPDENVADDETALPPDCPHIIIPMFLSVPAPTREDAVRIANEFLVPLGPEAMRAGLSAAEDALADPALPADERRSWTVSRFSFQLVLRHMEAAGIG
ncbi:MAG TPA: twin-arginine translocation signal domain-containing protein [Dehalococcoidia bacterium]|nr:twin-arginine translocation signal domain-containing protein [Dehalococcoidia bacterium]